MSMGPDRDEIPVCETTDDRDKEFQRAKESEEPFLVLTSTENGYMVSYDMHSTPYNLEDDPASDIRAMIEEWVRVYIEEITDPDFKRDDISHHSGRDSGAIWPLDRPEALDLAEEIGEMVFDESNWRKVSPREAFYGGM